MRIFVYSPNPAYWRFKRIEGYKLLSQAVVGKPFDHANRKSLLEAAETADKLDCAMVAVMPDGASIDDLKSMIDALPDSDKPTALIVGERANSACEPRGQIKLPFLLQLLTGELVADCATPMRLYPARLLLASRESRVSPIFGFDILIAASRHGYALRSALVDWSGDASALPADFHPGIAFFTARLLVPLLPIPRRRLCERNFQKESLKEFLLHPLKFIGFLLRENSSPAGLAAAAATGMFIGTLPLLGLHTLSIIYVSVKLRLNKIMSVNISHLCMPPFVPIACVELGHFVLNGEWLAFESWNVIAGELRLRILEWLLGSVILAPVNALAFWGITYAVAKIVRARLEANS